jgi:hypothetical protein
MHFNDKMIELYGKINNFPRKPSRLQSEHPALSENEVRDAGRIFTLMVEKELPAIISLRTKAGLEPLVDSKEPEAERKRKAKNNSESLFSERVCCMKHA